MRVSIWHCALALSACAALYACEPGGNNGGTTTTVETALQPCEWEARALGHLLDWWWIDRMYHPPAPPPPPGHTDERKGARFWARTHLEGNVLPPERLAQPPRADLYWDRLGNGDCTSSTFIAYRDSLVDFWLGTGSYPPPGAHEWLKARQKPPPKPPLKDLTFTGNADFDLNTHLHWWLDPGGAYHWVHENGSGGSPDDDPPPPPDPIN